MVKFELGLFISVLQRRIESSFDATFELTCKPSDTKLFAFIPDNERASYLKHVSVAFRIHFNNPKNNIQNVYLFFRNGLASDNSYTRLSSIEAGYINSGIFVPTFKHHFIGDLNKNIIGMISSFYFNTTEDMHDAVSDVATFVCNHLNTLFNSVISIGGN
jgi:hypothetical protein